MKTSIFLTSFFSRNRSGSKPFTSPAIRVENCDASNFVMADTPLWPAHSACQFTSVPIPSDDTRPMPVTTTRLFGILFSSSEPAEGSRPRADPCAGRGLFLRLGVRLDVLDGFLHARDLLGVLVGDLDAELLFERHHQFDGVERIGSEVVDERGIRRHLFLIHAELL